MYYKYLYAAFQDGNPYFILSSGLQFMYTAKVCRLPKWEEDLEITEEIFLSAAVSPNTMLCCA